MQLKIRKIEVQDAAQFNILKKRVESESAYMLYDKGENQSTDEFQVKFIEKLKSQDSPNQLFVAEVNDDLVGFIALMGTKLNKKSHIKEVAMGIVKDHSGKGLGGKLIEHAIDFARKDQIKRLELTVIIENKNAIKLYKKMGFIKEGTKKNSVFIDGKYIDEDIYGYML